MNDEQAERLLRILEPQYDATENLERLLRELCKAWTTLHDDLQMIAHELHTLNESTPISEWHRKNK